MKKKDSLPTEFLARLSTCVDKFDLILHAVFGLLLLLSAIFSKLYSAGWFSFSLACTYVLFLFWRCPHLLLKYLYFYFAVYINLLGVLVCEYSEIYLTELSCYSGFIGSLPTIVFVRWLFMAIIFLLDSIFDGAEISKTEVSEGSGFALDVLNVLISTLLLGTFLVTALSNAPAMVLGLDRFGYAEILVVPLAIQHIIQYLVLLPLVSWKLGRLKYLSGAAVLSYLAYLFWIGTKFGRLFIFLCCVLFIYYDQIKNLGLHVLHRLLGIVAAFMVVLFCFAVVFSTSTFGGSQVSYISSRLAQQGQLWWRTYGLCEEGTLDRDFQNEIDGIFASNSVTDNVGSDYAIYGIMYLTASEEQADAKLLAGSTYTEAGYATFYSYFGAAGAVTFSCVMALVIWLIVRGVTQPFDILSIVEIPIYGRFFINIIGCLTNATFYEFVDDLSCMSYIALLVFSILRRYPSSLAFLESLSNRVYKSTIGKLSGRVH